MQSYISREQDYALRITSMLAGLKKDETIPVSQLSKKLCISKSFASRIVHKLKKSAIVGTTQGLYGGVYINRNPKEISVFEVLDKIGFKTKFNQCLDGKYECELQSLCKFHTFFAIHEKKLLEELKNHSISEFTINF